MLNIEQVKKMSRNILYSNFDKLQGDMQKTLDMKLMSNHFFFSYFFQLLKEFQMVKPELEYYARLWSRNCDPDTDSINLNEWMALLHNAGNIEARIYKEG